MDAKNTGMTITLLRKKCGMTQAQLAEKLDVSNKTISRWENGLGFPEVTQFPVLASVFDVTVDYLMTGERNGIVIAGNMLADIVKQVDSYPEVGKLANITDISRAVGGCAPNTAINLAKIDRNIPIAVAGKIGDDESGRYVLSQFGRYNIDCRQVSISPDKPTGFSDVITTAGDRIFLHNRGANVEFSPADVDIASFTGAILHIGYLLLLDFFDKTDAEYGTVMARFLHDVQEQGIKTSIDVVCDHTADFKGTVLPALKYCDYVILNETESSMLSGLEPYNSDGKLNVENICKTMQYMAACGVREKVIVHCEKAGFCYDVPTGKFTMAPSLCIPNEEIKGSVGVGDAFCAGILYGLYHHYDDKRLLEFAACAAACNLFSENAVDGMRKKEEIEKLSKKYEWRVL